MPTTRPSLVRLLKIHQMIAAKTNPTIVELAVQCGVTARTIKRDLRLLREEFGAPLAVERRGQGYGYTREFSLSELPLSEGELLALCMITSLTDTLRDTPFAPAVRRALHKLQLLLPEPAKNLLDDACPSISHRPDPAPPERAETAVHFNALLHAIEERRQVRMSYFSMSSNAESERVIDPYHLYYHQGMWYLHAWCHSRGEERDFALERIRAIAALATTFPAPDLSAIKAKLAQRFSVVTDSLVEVAIRFDADEARRIRERIWHPSQQITDHADGSCTLTMTVEGLPSITRWVLSYGRHARVLSPPALVRLVEEEIRAMAALVSEPFIR